jgi:hypothetical protein
MTREEWEQSVFERIATANETTARKLGELDLMQLIFFALFLVGGFLWLLQASKR